MAREWSNDLQTIFQAYKRRDWLNLYLADDTALNLSRGAVKRNGIAYDNWIASVEELNCSIDTAIDRITINCQNVDSLLGFNVASNLRLLDYAVAEYGKIYQSIRNPTLVADLDTFRCVLANGDVEEERIAFELIADYESLGSVVAARGLSPRCWWTYKNGIECTSVSSHTDCGKTRLDCGKRGKPEEFGGWEFFQEPTSDLPGAGGNDGGGIGSCFTGETLLWTPDGDVPIGEIRTRFARGRRSIYSFNPLTGEIIEDEILEVFEHRAKSYFTFWFEHGRVNVTPEHPFLVDFGQFKIADELTRGKDSVKIFDGKNWHDSRLLKIKHNSDARETVWNIRVRENQDYFANRCGVHNTKNNGSASGHGEYQP